MLETKKAKSLLDELKKLAEIKKFTDFNFFQDIDSLPAEEREAAFLLKKVLDNVKSTAEYDLMRYQLTGKSLGVGHWDMVITGNAAVSPDNPFIWSPELRQMLGYCDDCENGDYSGTLANWLEHLHPDDREKAQEAFMAHIRDRTGKTQLVTEYRMKKTNGAYIFVRAFGEALRDNTGIPVRIAGAIEEITEAKQMRDTLMHREKTLDILNRVALVLLAREKKAFAGAMTEGLDLISGITDIDRMSIFRNSEHPDGLHLSQIYRWRKDVNGTVDVWKELNDVPYSSISPQIEPILASGQCFGGHVNHLPGSEIFKRFGCETILGIPIFDDGKYWGAALFERLNETTFTEQETDVLRSASFMLANAVIRNEEAAIVRQANEQARLMLDAAPLAVTMWDKNFNIIDCSQTALDVFGFSSKQELIKRMIENAPEYQPCGRRSMEVLAEAATEAFQTGSCHLEWTGQTTGGESIIFEDIAVRVKYKGDYALMLYSRDIREEKRMLEGLAARDKMLAEQAHWYKSLLDGIPLPVNVTDADMNLTFTNAAAENVFNKKREDLIGLPCSLWSCPICSTENCSIVRAKQGHKQSFFKLYDKSWKVDTEIVRDISGKTIGYLEILHDITEVENLARRQADAANEAKSAFLATMSHEMRTPLSAVIGLSELVLENGGLNQDNEVYLDKIYNAGSTLLGIVNDILDISKIEAGKFEIMPQEYDVPSLINDTITQNILRIHSKPVQFSLVVNENTPVRLRGDEIRVKQIVSNLLSNAFKYTDEGEVELRIDYEREGDSVWTTFRIRDTGAGIKPEDINQLFSDYTRFDEANRKIGGTGLGLSITKRLVELMDGSVTAESEYGKGSVFTAKIRQQFVNETVIGSEMAEHLREFQYTTNKRRSGAQLNRVRIPYARVLVVDDNKTNLDIALGLMRPYGMGVDCVTSGQAAIDAIRDEKNKYSAVFMDHMMPGMDGMEAVRIIREEIGSEYARTIPIIALTANAITGNKERFISQGFNAFVSKPIDIFRLDSVIKRWIWKKKNKDSEPDDSRAFVERRKRQDRRKSGDRRIGGRRNLCPIPVFSEVIEGLDWMKGIELFGDSDSFQQVLRSFAVNTRPLLNSLMEINEEALPQYAITVHGIKSSSRSIGATVLGGMAESLEFAAKDGNLDFITLHNSGFLTAARKLIADIEALLDKNMKAESKPRKDRPGDAELTRLRAACEDFNMDEIEAAMREIERYEYTADNGLSEWLSDNVERLNYAQVVERIAQVTKETSI